MTDSHQRLAYPTRSTDSLVWSYGRTDGRTNEEPHSPSDDISPFVTHARAYGFPIAPKTAPDADARREQLRQAIEQEASA